jgi:ankyrin repeat protein
MAQKGEMTFSYVSGANVSNKSLKTVSLQVAKGNYQGVDAVLKTNPAMANEIYKGELIVGGDNMAIRDGDSPVIIGCRFQVSPNIINLLVSKGANISYNSTDGHTGFTLACATDQLDTCKIFVEKGYNINEKSNNGTYGVIEAAKTGDVAIINFLISKGANLEVCDSDGYSAFLYSCRRANLPLFTTLVNKGNVNAVAKDGNNALILACEFGFIDAVRVLVDKNVDMKHKNGRGVTALVAAARKKHMNIVNLLLAKGADAESVIDADGKTLLLYACGNGYVDTVKILLEKRANIHAINKDGDDAFNVACKETYFFNIDVVKCLIKHIIKIGAQDLLFKFDNHDKLPFDYISNDKVREDLEVYAEELIEKGDASSNHNSAKDNALESTSAPDAAAAGAAAGAATDNSKPETTAEKPSFRHTRQASMKAKEIAATPDEKKDCTCLIM